MTDPLAAFRKKPATMAAAVTPPSPPKATDEYVAFNTQDRVERLLIRQADDPYRSPGYGYLLDISHDGEYGTNFVLHYSFMMLVMVEGKNLQSVITALQMGTASFIQEYDPDRWPQPKDPKAPLIESITVITQQGGPPSPENGKEAAAKGQNLH